MIITLDNKRRYILLHGKKTRHLMEAKAVIKNILESMVCIFVKDTTVEYKILAKYLKKATLFPVHFMKFNQNIAIIISKDNILKQLINKSASFMKYIGLDQGVDETQKEVDPTVGFYVLPSFSLDTKMEKIKDKAQSKGYDIYSHLGIRYFRRVFTQAGKEKTNDSKELLSDLTQCIEQNKTKHEVSKFARREEEAPK